MRAKYPTLIGAALMLSIGMGLRQSLGLFLQPLTRDLALAVADFTVAIAVQNVAWGILQPIAGALVARWGFRPLMMPGAALYAAGLVVLATAQGLLGVVLGAGVLIGAALACTASAIALAVSARTVSVERRSTVLGMVTAAGSLGSVVAAPLGQILSDSAGWRVGVLSFAVLASLMLPAAWLAGSVDRLAVPARRQRSARRRHGARGDRRCLTQRLIPDHGRRLLRLRHAADLHRHPPAVLPRPLRPGSDAER